MDFINFCFTLIALSALHEPLNHLQSLLVALSPLFRCFFTMTSPSKDTKTALRKPILRLNTFCISCIRQAVMKWPGTGLLSQSKSLALLGFTIPNRAPVAPKQNGPVPR